MLSKNVLIGKLSPFLGKKDVLVFNQDTSDIITGLMSNHNKYEKEYDKIYQYFLGDTVDETSYNVWAFLKDNFKYTIEPEKMQILRSPAAILGSDIVGIDCKGYATFANGIMSAVKRNTGENFDVLYRFASYDPFDSTPQHVFSVIKENGKEYWIDPVLDNYDEKKQPYYFKDKKIKNMALVAMSGINSRLGDTTPTYDQYGNLVDYSGGGVILDASGNPVSQTTTGGSWFSQLLQAAPSIVKVFTPTQTYSPYTTSYKPTTTQTTSSTGISSNTLLLLGAAGIGAYLLLRKKRR